MSIRGLSHFGLWDERFKSPGTPQLVAPSPLESHEIACETESLVRSSSFELPEGSCQMIRWIFDQDYLEYITKLHVAVLVLLVVAVSTATLVLFATPTRWLGTASLLLAVAGSYQTRVADDFLKQQDHFWNTTKFPNGPSSVWMRNITMDECLLLAGPSATSTVRKFQRRERLDWDVGSRRNRLAICLGSSMAFLEYRPTRTLYQYCSPILFRGITGSKRLWFSDLNAANDPREIRLGHKKFIAAIRYHADRELHAGRRNYLNVLSDKLTA